MRFPSRKKLGGPQGLLGHVHAPFAQAVEQLVHGQVEDQRTS